MIKQVIFWDFDGTLTHAKSLWTKSLCRALAETAVDIVFDVEILRACLRRGFPWHTPEQDFTACTGDAWWVYMNHHFYESYLACGIPAEIAMRATEKIRGIIKDPANYHYYEDTIAALIGAKALGCCNVLLSNNYPDLAEVTDAIGLSRYLDGIIVSGAEGYDKPRKELFALAMQRYPAEQYYMVGDNPAADIAGGGAAGMTTVYVHKGVIPEADYCFEDLLSVVELISKEK